MMHYLNFQSVLSPFSIPKLHLKYTKEILKNTKENIGQSDPDVISGVHIFTCQD